MTKKDRLVKKVKRGTSKNKETKKSKEFRNLLKQVPVSSILMLAKISWWMLLWIHHHWLW